MKKALSLLTVVACTVVISSSRPAAQVLQPVVTVNVVGTLVTATWTPVVGATSYRVDVGTFSGGTDIIAVNVGGALSGAGNLNLGAYFIKVVPFAGGTAGTPSAEVSFNVGVPKPGVPVGFAASLNGPILTFNWRPPLTGGAPSGYVVQVGTVFGESNLHGGYPVGAGTDFSINISGILGVGTYYARLIAGNATGASGPSDEAVFSIGLANVPGVPTPNDPVVNGNSVTLSWNPPAGGAAVTEYALEARADINYGLVQFLRVPGDQTSISYPGVPNGRYYWRIRAYNGGTPGGAYGVTSLFVGPIPPTPAGPRTPNPGLGRRLPEPTYGASVARNTAAFYGGDLANSCKEFGGNNIWMFKLVRELRRIDTRWQLNWKRGGVGDMSQDVVTYNYGSMPDEGTTDVYIFDAIGGHCGNNPTWNWQNNTKVTIDSNTIGKGTLIPYIQGGFTP